MGRRRVSRSALLDTSALINAVDARAVASLPFERLFIASLTYAELRLGLATATDLTVLRQRMQRVDDITRLFGPGLPFDDACALEYQRIVERAVGGGCALGVRRICAPKTHLRMPEHAQMYFASVDVRPRVSSRLMPLRWIGAALRLKRVGSGIDRSRPVSCRLGRCKSLPPGEPRVWLLRRLDLGY